MHYSYLTSTETLCFDHYVYGVSLPQNVQLVSGSTLFILCIWKSHYQNGLSTRTSVSLFVRFQVESHAGVCLVWQEYIYRWRHAATSVPSQRSVYHLPCPLIIIIIMTACTFLADMFFVGTTYGFCTCIDVSMTSNHLKVDRCKLRFNLKIKFHKMMLFCTEISPSGSEISICTI
jgi:hypothetical protein